MIPPCAPLLAALLPWFCRMIPPCAPLLAALLPWFCRMIPPCAPFSAGLIVVAVGLTALSAGLSAAKASVEPSAIPATAVAKFVNRMVFPPKGSEFVCLARGKFPLAAALLPDHEHLD